MVYYTFFYINQTMNLLHWWWICIHYKNIPLNWPESRFNSDFAVTPACMTSLVVFGIKIRWQNLQKTCQEMKLWMHLIHGLGLLLGNTLLCSITPIFFLCILKILCDLWFFLQRYCKMYDEYNQWDIFSSIHTEQKMHGTCSHH